MTADPIGGRRFPGPRAEDAALRDVLTAISAAVTAGCHPSLILGEVANGLTGRLNGPVERAASKAMTDAYLLTTVAADEVAS